MAGQSAVQAGAISGRLLAGTLHAVQSLPSGQGAVSSVLMWRRKNCLPPVVSSALSPAQGGSGQGGVLYQAFSGLAAGRTRALWCIDPVKSAAHTRQQPATGGPKYSHPAQGGSGQGGVLRQAFSGLAEGRTSGSLMQYFDLP